MPALALVRRAGTASGRARGIHLLPYDAQTKGDIVHSSDITPLPVHRLCRLRNPALTVKRVLMVVWPPFYRPGEGSGDGLDRRRAEPVRIPPGLAGPVEIALARSVDEFPDPHALPGGSRYEVKWDG